MKKKILSVLLVALLAFVPFAGCSDDESDSTIRFWGYGDANTKAAYDAMTNAYNAGQGKIDGVKVNFSNKPESGYISLIEQSATSKTGPDVYFAWDRLFKKWTAADMTVNLTEFVDASTQAGDLDLTKIWSSTVSRFRYNKELNMSGEKEDIYGLPIDTSPTALYYNKTALTDRGVIVISVAAEDMDAWNAGTIADNYGKRKSDFAALSNITVPAKGFFRDDAYTRKTEQGGTNWIQPASGVALVFNDQIAMNWDEIEDLGFLMTASKNSGSNTPSTDYGYYTEWWFNYGWSVGGDCVVDMSGNGSWAYSHGDWSENYIVAEGKTFTGAITGKVYQAGETLEFLDKIDCQVGDEITADNKGSYLKNGSSMGDNENKITSDAITRPAVKDAVTDGTLIALPSIREAFTRFCRLAGQSGSDLNICPYPSSFSTTSSIQYFTSGKVAMIVERGYQIPTVNDYVGTRFEWAVAPLPIFKEYTDVDTTADAKANAYNTEVKRQGKIAGHSESTALVIRQRSTKQEAAWKFIRWMVSEEAQKIKASYGFIPNQKSEVDTFYDALDADGSKNLAAFVEAAEYETPGDWWYMVNRDWIDVWASPLNSNVRNGNLTLDEYFTQYIPAGNAEVRSYGNWDNGLNLVTAG